MARRKTPADYHALAEKRGFKWLGPEVSNTETKTGWACREGHKWEAIYGNVRKGSGCPVCAGVAPKVSADYLTLAEKRGFRWLGPQVSNTATKTEWACREGHKWEACYSDIQQGTGCPTCGLAAMAAKRRLAPGAYHALARLRGIQWLGPEVPNAQTKTGWECEEGHQWEARYNSIQQGRGCPVCANRVPKDPADYYTLAEERGFRWLGPEVPNVRTKTGWQCDQGHQWEADYDHIRSGRGCPTCAIADMVERLRLKPKDYRGLAEGRGLRWLGPEVPRNNVKTRWECEQGHQWEAAYSDIQQGSGCPDCAGLSPKEPADYHVLAEERGFRWLGPDVPNVRAKTSWECPEGHRWDANYTNIQSGKGCPVCSVAITADKLRHKTGDYHTLAEKRGFRWLGPEVPTANTKTGWACEEGHQWEAPYGSIQQGTGCPICVDMVHGARVSQVQRDLCDMLGGELNHPFGRKNIDVALELGGAKIAVEYDAWYWHANRDEDDTRRDAELIAAGWRVLRVKSNELLPSQEQVDQGIARLLAGEERVEIVLEDWGEGPTFVDRG